MQSVTIITIVVMAAIFLGIPAVVIWLLAPKDVRLTTEYFSPSAWTDGKPVPVIALSLLLAFTSAAIVAGIMYPVFPLFGAVLSGIAAVAALLVVAGVLALLAINVLRRRPWAWAATLALALLWSADALVTSLRVSPLELQRLAGHPQEELDAMAKMGDTFRHMAVAFAVAFGGIASPTCSM